GREQGGPHLSRRADHQRAHRSGSPSKAARGGLMAVAPYRSFPVTATANGLPRHGGGSTLRGYEVPARTGREGPRAAPPRDRRARGRVRGPRDASADRGGTPSAGGPDGRPLPARGRGPVSGRGPAPWMLRDRA